MYSDSYSWEYGRRFVLDSDWLTSQCLSAPIFLLLAVIMEMGNQSQRKISSKHAYTVSSSGTTL